MRTVNLREGLCRHECRTTCATGRHATDGSPGVVRECDHGALWEWEYEAPGYFGNLLHHWRRLSPVRDWRTIRKARAALATPADPTTEETHDG